MSFIFLYNYRSKYFSLQKIFSRSSCNFVVKYISFKWTLKWLASFCKILQHQILRPAVFESLHAYEGTDWENITDPPQGCKPFYELRVS
jgi:hypothetical protein